jgi:tetratricopeptide (TPR) repeat protein
MPWTAFPYPEAEYAYTAASLKKNWARLHVGDAEPFPEDKKVQEAWIAFHAGEFEKARKLGLAAGGAGITCANKAQAIYANYIEDDEAKALAHFDEVAKRAEAQQAAEPKNANAYYWHAYAIGRYSQGISIAKALAQGLAGKVKDSLTMAIKLAPKHADAHIALGAYHAEIVNKVGSLVGGMTYGAKKDLGIAAYKKALELMPESAIARIEYANGLVMFEPKKNLKQAEELYAEAAECEPMDAMERLDVEMALSELEDE